MLQLPWSSGVLADEKVVPQPLVNFKPLPEPLPTPRNRRQLQVVEFCYLFDSFLRPWNMG
jgi:hypothetical protein